MTNLAETANTSSSLAASDASPRILTAEDFAALPSDGRRKELVRGRVVNMNMPFPRHGVICARIAHLLLTYVEANDLGRVLSNDAGVVTQRHPDTVRGADVVFYSFARLPKGPLPDHYPPLAPEIVFEVVSPSDRSADVVRKVGEYLEAGVNHVCVVDPDPATVAVYSQDQAVRIARGDDEITFPDFLPGFSVTAKELLQA